MMNTAVQNVEIPMIDFTGKKCEVIVVNVVDPGDFWVRLNEHTTVYQSLRTRLHLTYSCEAYSNQYQYYPFSACAVMSSVDGLWHRALIGNICPNAGAVTVFLFDEGRSEAVPFTSIRPLKPEFAQIPRLAVACKLQGIKPFPKQFSTPGLDQWSETAITKFQTTVMTGPLFCSFFKPHEVEGRYDVILYESVYQQSVSAILLRGHGAALISEGTDLVGEVAPISPMNQLATKKPFIRQDMTGMSCECQITCFNSIDCFYVQDRLNIQYLQQFDRNVDEMAKRTMLLKADFEIGDSCLSHYEIDKCHHRAKVIAVLEEGNGYQVHFVDYGTIGCVGKDQCVPIVPHLMVNPPFAHKCGLKDVTLISGREAQVHKIIMDLASNESHYGRLVCRFMSFEQANQTYDVRLVVTNDEMETDVLTLLEPHLLSFPRYPQRDILIPPQTSTTPVISNRALLATELPKFRQPTLELNLNTMEMIYVCCCVDVDEFYVWMLSKFETNDTYQREIQDYFQNRANNSVVSWQDIMPSMAVVVRSFDSYRRATILSKRRNNEVEVKLVDFGRKINVRHENVFYCPKMFQNDSAQAIACCLDGFEDYSRGDITIAKKFKDITEFCVFNAKLRGATDTCRQLLSLELFKVPWREHVLPRFADQHDFTSYTQSVNLLLLIRDQCNELNRRPHSGYYDQANESEYRRRSGGGFPKRGMGSPPIQQQRPHSHRAPNQNRVRFRTPPPHRRSNDHPHHRFQRNSLYEEDETTRPRLRPQRAKSASGRRDVSSCEGYVCRVHPLNIFQASNRSPPTEGNNKLRFNLITFTKEGDLKVKSLDKGNIEVFQHRFLLPSNSFNDLNAHIFVCQHRERIFSGNCNNRFIESSSDLDPELLMAGLFIEYRHKATPPQVVPHQGEFHGTMHAVMRPDFFYVQLDRDDNLKKRLGELVDRQEILCDFKKASQVYGSTCIVYLMGRARGRGLVQTELPEKDYFNVLLVDEGYLLKRVNLNSLGRIVDQEIWKIPRLAYLCGFARYPEVKRMDTWIRAHLLQRITNIRFLNSYSPYLIDSDGGSMRWTKKRSRPVMFPGEWVVCTHQSSDSVMLTSFSNHEFHRPDDLSEDIRPEVGKEYLVRVKNIWIRAVSMNNNRYCAIDMCGKVFDNIERISLMMPEEAVLPEMSIKANCSQSFELPVSCTFHSDSEDRIKLFETEDCCTCSIEGTVIVTKKIIKPNLCSLLYNENVSVDERSFRVIRKCLSRPTRIIHRERSIKLLEKIAISSMNNNHGLFLRAMNDLIELVANNQHDDDQIVKVCVDDSNGLVFRFDESTGKLMDADICPALDWKVFDIKSNILVKLGPPVAVEKDAPLSTRLSKEVDDVLSGILCRLNLEA
ncbi:hypothetical protein ACOME3_003584 [Neoechinorhynchus agilis]